MTVQELVEAYRVKEHNRRETDRLQKDQFGAQRAVAFATWLDAYGLDLLLHLYMPPVIGPVDQWGWATIWCDGHVRIDGAVVLVRCYAMGDDNVMVEARGYEPDGFAVGQGVVVRRTDTIQTVQQAIGELFSSLDPNKVWHTTGAVRNE